MSLAISTSSKFAGWICPDLLDTDIIGFHEPGDASSRAADATLFERCCHTWSTVTCLGLRVGLLDLCQQHRVLICSIARITLPWLSRSCVIARVMHLQHTALNADRVLHLLAMNELVFHRGGCEKIPTSFVRMSRSVRSSSTSLRSRSSYAQSMVPCAAGSADDWLLEASRCFLSHRDKVSVFNPRSRAICNAYNH